MRRSTTTTIERPGRGLTGAGTKIAILANDLTYLGEDRLSCPTAMVEVGGKPLLWHALKGYSAQGFNDFSIALGVQGESIKRYLLDYSRLAGDLCIDLKDGRVQRKDYTPPPWRIDLVDGAGETGTAALTRLRTHLGDEAFVLATGDCLCDADLGTLLAFHRSHGALATALVARPAARFGKLEIQDGRVVDFAEKPAQEQGWVSGGLFVLEPAALDYIALEDDAWERGPLEPLAAAGELRAYKHDSFWQRMETLRDKRLLEDLWQAGNPPWKNWEERG